MFRPDPHDTLTIDGVTYAIAEHPSAPGMPHGQEGRAGTVYHLLPSYPPGESSGKAAGGKDQGLALKVFKPRFRLPYLVSQAQRIAALADLPGLSACRRTVLTPSRHADLLRDHPDLTYAVLMPWIEGPTWLEVLVEKQPFTPQQSLQVAQAFAGVLLSMEEQGIAHCDLSAPNVMLPALAQTGGEGVELIDLEGLYAPGLTQPNALSSGSAGYAHQEAAGGLWRPEADRFAGAVLLGEMLGWCDPPVVEGGWGESYFEPGEVQQDSPRSRALLDSLRRHWGAGVAALFERAWRSDSLADCPTFGEWLVALPQAVAAVQSAEQDETRVIEGDEESSVHGPPSVIAEIRVLLQAARRMEEKGDLQSAEELYRQAVELAQGEPAAGGLAKEIELLLQELRRKGQARAEQLAPTPAPKPEPLPAPSASSLDRPSPPAPRPPLKTWLPVGGLAFGLGLLCILVPLVVLVVLGLRGDGPLAALAMSTPGPTPTATRTPMLTHTPTPISLPVRAGTPMPQPVVAISPGNVGQIVELTLLNTTGNAMAFSPDGSLLAVASENIVKLWRVIDGTLIHTFEGHEEEVKSISFSPDGMLLASSSDDAIHLWRVLDGALLSTPTPIPPTPDVSGIVAGEGITVYDPNDSVVSFSPDGTLLAVGYEDHVSLRLISNGKTIRELALASYSSVLSYTVKDVAFSPDGMILASVGGGGIYSVRLWRLLDGALLRELEGHTSDVTSVAFSPDGQNLASGSYDETVRLWRVVDGMLLYTLEGHTNIVTNVAFSPDGQILASGSVDNTVRLWRVADGTLLRTLEGHTNDVTSVVFSPDGNILTSGSDDGTIRVWGVRP